MDLHQQVGAQAVLGSCPRRMSTAVWLPVLKGGMQPNHGPLDQVGSAALHVHDGM